MTSDQTDLAAEVAGGDSDTAAFIALLDDLRSIDEPAERRSALTQWCRSDLWHPAGMILEDWQGALHREAWGYLRRDLAAATPGKAWSDTPPQRGRDTIAKLLSIDGGGAYALAPFRTLWTAEDEPWIAGAVGCPPCFDFEEVKRWHHVDISDVVLWNPRTGGCRLMGDAAGSVSVIAPAAPPERLRVYAECGAYFRDWARARRDFLIVRHRHGLTEPLDGGLPGILIIGDPDLARLPLHLASELVAGPGLDRRSLQKMVFRSANLPRVSEDQYAA